MRLAGARSRMVMTDGWIGRGEALARLGVKSQTLAGSPHDRIPPIRAEASTPLWISPG